MQYYIPIKFSDNLFTLSNDDKHHIINVLRMQSGEEIYVIFEGRKYKCSLKISNNEFRVLVIDSEELLTELNVKVTLIYGLPRLEKFELVLQKAVELGVSKVVPFFSEFSIVKIDKDRIETKLNRWNKIIKEASEQSHRAKLLEVVNPLYLKDVRSHLSELNIIANENLSSKGTKGLLELINTKTKSITIIVGPEGGFSNSELEELKMLGFKSVSLGKRILRSETAAIYLMSAVSLFAESID